LNNTTLSSSSVASPTTTPSQLVPEYKPPAQLQEYKEYKSHSISPNTTANTIASHADYKLTHNPAGPPPEYKLPAEYKPPPASSHALPEYKSQLSEYKPQFSSWYSPTGLGLNSNSSSSSSFLASPFGQMTHYPGSATHQMY
jgi:hypothetical protein